MVHRLKSKLLTLFRDTVETYNKNLKDLKIGRWERDEVYLKSAKLIGMTTTGLSKYRPLVASLKPKIVLIEEAAEVLEGPVTVACMESVEHLILVGDHEQLQGHCSVRQLEGEPFHLNVSLFERLVRNDMPYKTLLLQRRMDPQFRQLLLPIYPHLDDHASVKTRPMLDCGVAKKAYFFNHSWWESRDTQMSTYNEEEAAFIAGFYRHLVINGVPPSEVTILTFYNGQRKRLLKEIRQYLQLKQEYNNVKTVDSYQGEENTIVILSLARHNEYHKIGFLENQNRVCVALSRAKRGK
jgi:helicase required for RNAi-mediated heterochromatin assembly 1